jgi:hypothetical protein
MLVALLHGVWSLTDKYLKCNVKNNMTNQAKLSKKNVAINQTRE